MAKREKLVKMKKPSGEITNVPEGQVWRFKTRYHYTPVSEEKKSSSISRRSGGGGSSSSSSSKPKKYYIKPGTYEGVYAMATTGKLPPQGSGWKEVSKEEYERHCQKGKEYWESKRKEKLEKRISRGDKKALKEWEEKYGSPKVSDVVITKDPKTGKEVEIPVAKTSYGTYLYQLPGGETKELKPGIGKLECYALGEIAREYHKSVLGKSPSYAVSFGSVKRENYEKYQIAKEYSDIKEGKKSVWVTPDDKLIVSKGTKPPGGLSEKGAKELGFRKLKPSEVKLEEGKLVGLISKTPKIEPKSLGGAKVVEMGKGGTSIISVPLGEEPLMGQGTRLPTEKELPEFQQKILKEQKKLNEWEEMRARWRGILEREKQKEQVTKEFEQMDTYPKRWVSLAIGLKNIPDIAELTYLKATGQEEKWREKRAEMLLEFKELGKEIVEKPTEGVPKALTETFTEGAGQLPLYAGIGRITAPAVGKLMTEAAKTGVKTGATVKGLLYGTGAVAVTVPFIDVTMEGIRGNMQNVVRKSAQYGTELGAFTLGAVSSQPILKAEVSSEKFTGKFIENLKSRETPFSLFKSKIRAFQETKTGTKTFELKPKSVVELRPTITEELVNARGKTIGEISEGVIKFSTKEIESPITGKFISITKNGKIRGLIEIPEQKIGTIKIKRQIINLNSEDIASLERKGLIRHIKGKIPEPMISKEGKIVGATAKEGDVTIQPFVRKGITKDLQVRRIQKTGGRLDFTKKNIDKQFLNVVDESYNAYLEAGEVMKISPKKSYAAVKGITSEGVKYKVAEVRIRKPVRNYLDEHLVKMNKNIDNLYKNIAEEKPLPRSSQNIDNIYKNIAKEMKLPESKVGVVEKVSKLKLRGEKLPERKSLTERLWEERRRLALKAKEREGLPKRREERFWRERRTITEKGARRSLRLKGVERVGVSASLTTALHRMNQIQKQVLKSSPIQSTREIIKPIIKEPTKMPERKQVPNIIQDIFRKLDQQYYLINTQIQQPIQTAPPQPPTPTTIPTRIQLPPEPPPPPPPKKPKKTPVIFPLGLPFAGIGIGAIDSQYRTITKHIKHSIPRVEKLLEL